MTDYFRCPKCGTFSGADWSQCSGGCPVAASPHYDEHVRMLFGPLEQRTEEEYKKEMQNAWRN